VRTRLRLIWLSPAFRVAAVVVVLAAALAVALWPRGGDTGQRPAAQRHSQPARTSLAASRARADLPACPSAAGHGVVARLRGVRLTCLADGSHVDLGEALAGHTTVLNIWATYCAPCKTELGILQSYAREPGSAHVLEVQYGTSPRAGLSMLASLGVRLPAVHDSAGQALRALDAPHTLPASYVITPAGAVHFVAQPRVFGSPGAVAAAVHRYGGES
jgi:thiol-disulfide isomerase/thioredoxin